MQFFKHIFYIQNHEPVIYLFIVWYEPVMPLCLKDGFNEADEYLLISSKFDVL